MKLARRKVLRLAVGAAVLPSLVHRATASNYPTRQVRIVVPNAPGAGQDLVARLIGQRLTEKLGQPFVIENRPGGSTNIATDMVVRSPPDGYTLLWFGTASAINVTLFDKLSFDFARDIGLVAAIMHNPHVLVVNTSFPAKTVPEFIEYAKMNSISVGTTGTGSLSHAMAELFRMKTGINMVPVPYRGLEPAQTDLLGGQIHTVFTSLTSGIGYIKAGQLKPLAISTATRSPLLPEVLPLDEFVPGYNAHGWQGAGVPKNTPPDIIATLNQAINDILSEPKIKSRLTELGGTPAPGSPAEFTSFFTGEVKKWAEVAKFSASKK